MTWTILVWILLYFAVGWILTKIYDLDGDIWELLIFLGWPLLAVFCLGILTLLILFALAYAADEALYHLFHNRRDKF